MGEVTIRRPGLDQDLVLEVDEVHEQIEGLTKAGWQRVGPLWKAPGDAGVTSRKWTTMTAHRQLAQILQREAEEAAAAKKPRSRARKKS